jgi:hypothetical protein
MTTNQILTFERREDSLKNMEKEIAILYELGLEDYEVDYLIFLKSKIQARKKWGR